MSVVIMVGAAILLCLIGIPVAVAIGISTLVAILLEFGWIGGYNAMLATFGATTSFPLLAVPMFILAGALMNTTSISQRLLTFVSALVGFVRGGLGMINIASSMFFAEISGAAVSDVAALGSILIPEMKKRGYRATFAAAITSSSASLAIIIPPSIPMIVYGAISETSIIQLFVAGIIPGLVGGSLLMLVTYYFAVKFNLPRDSRFDLRRLGAAARDAGWALSLPVIILGGIFGGIVTATEAAGLAVLTALLIGTLVYRELDPRLLIKSLSEGVVQTASVMLLVATAAMLGLYMTEMHVPQNLTRWALSLTDNTMLILLLLNVLLLILGMFLHSMAAIILIVPILMPLVEQLQIDPVQFGLMVTLNVAIGQQTPPVASVLATACAIARTDIMRTTKANLPFISVLVLVLLLVTYWPQFSLVLVEYFYR